MEKYKVDMVMFKLKSTEIGSCLSCEDFDLDCDEFNLILEEIKIKKFAELQNRNGDEVIGVCFFGLTVDGLEYLDNIDNF